MRTFLAIDVGNTNAKYALFKNSKLVKFWSHATADTATRCATVLAETIVPIALSSVVPDATALIKQFAGKRELVEVTAATQTVLKNMPAEMGADRVAAAIAAWKIFGKGRKPVIVMGFGSATTLLAIDAGGTQRGGWIAPGLSMQMDSLHRLALLPSIAMQTPGTQLGHTTETHTRNGVFVMHLGGAKEALQRAESELGCKAITVATGGWASTLQEHEAIFDHVDPELTLKGIYMMARAATTGRTSARRRSRAKR